MCQAPKKSIASALKNPEKSRSEIVEPAEILVDEQKISPPLQKNIDDSTNPDNSFIIMIEKKMVTTNDADHFIALTIGFENNSLLELEKFNISKDINSNFPYLLI